MKSYHVFIGWKMEDRPTWKTAGEYAEKHHDDASFFCTDKGQAEGFIFGATSEHGKGVWGMIEEFDRDAETGTVIAIWHRADNGALVQY